MKQKSKSFFIISTLVTLCMIGLITVQFILLIQSVQFQKAIFRQNANLMLSSVIQKLEELNAIDQIISVSAGVDDQGVYSQTKLHIKNQQKSENGISLQNIQHYQSAVAFDSNMVVVHLNETSQVRLVLLDTLKKELREVYSSEKPAGIHQIPIDDLADKQIVHFNLYINKTKHTFYLDKSSPGRLIVDPELEDYRARLINKIIGQYMLFKPVPIQKRLKFTAIDSIINITKVEHNFMNELCYGIFNSNSDSLIFKSHNAKVSQLIKSKFRKRLFPHDSFIEPNDLVFFFPNQTQKILAQLSTSAIFAFLFLITILISFFYILHTLWAQKRFSKLLIDFINNMTHEFKTPLSTISITSETIKKQEVLQNKERVIRYSNIIYDESYRMHKLVENILDMAALEKGEVELNLESISIHQLLYHVTDHFKLHLEKQQGKLNLNFAAENDNIHADKIHMMNVIHNILDNAVKYCQRTPEISILTLNQDKQFVIIIKDNGPGIDTEHQKRIFEKYYRIPTGNLHDVKGFGLGLSYVKLIVEAHQGSVGIESVLGKSSKFIIKLPIETDNS